MYKKILKISKLHKKINFIWKKLNILYTVFIFNIILFSNRN